MAYDSNTSQFVRTYGKPRRTQRIGQDSLWHDDLFDDFDKCMANEDVQQPTFISPEPAGSVTMHKHKIQKNKTNGAGVWSKHLQSTLTSHKSQSVDVHNKKKPLLKKAEIKTKDNNCINISFSSDTDSDVSSNLLKVTSRVISRSSKKSKKLFVLPRSQCSTPHQKFLFANRKQFNGFSLKKNMKKTKYKSKADCTITSPCTPKFSKKLDYSHINGSNSKFKTNEKKKQFEQSILVSGSCLPLTSNPQINLKNKPIKNAMGKYHRTYHKHFSNKHSKTNKDKKNKISSDEKHSDWYNDVLNIFQGTNAKKSLEKNSSSYTRRSKKEVSPKNTSLEDNYSCTIFINKSNKNESCDNHNVGEVSNITFKTPNLNTYNDGESDDSLYVSCHQVHENKIIKNTDSSKYVCKNGINVSVNNENDVDRHSSTNCDTPQLSRCEMSYNNSDYLIQNDVELCTDNLEIKSPIISLGKLTLNHSSIENLQIKSPNILEQKESKKPCNCVNFNQAQHLLAKNVSLQSSDSESVINASVSDTVPQIVLDITKSMSDMTFNDKIKHCNWSSNLSFNKSSLNHSSTDSLEIESPNILEQKQSNKPNNCVNFNQAQHLLAKNVSLQSNDGEFVASVSDTESLIMVDTTNNISDLISNDEIKHCNRSSNLYFNKKSSLNHSILYDSSIYSLSSLEQDTTVIYKEQNVDTMFENSLGFNDMQEQSIMPLKTLNNCSTSEQLFNHKSRSNTFVSDNSYFKNMSCITYEKKTTAEDQTYTNNNAFDENLEETGASNLSKNILRRKRYAGRFQSSMNFNSFSIETIYENESQFQNSSQRYPCSKSILSKQNAQGFRLEPGKKWRRSLTIVRTYMEGNLDQTINFVENSVKGRKWISTVDDIIRRQSICISADQKSEQSILKNPISVSYQRYSEKHSTENEIAKKYIFEKCNQKEPIPFESWLKPKIKKTWKKVGEGVYGEVFSYTLGKSSTVVKIIPIEGKTYINNERQKMMFEVFSEVLIAVELNKLFDKNDLNYAKSFCKIKNISCVQGKYPEYLIKLWKDYDNNTNQGSDNDNPSILPDTQMFIILEMEDGGVDVEHFWFNSASQALFAFLQIVFGLAVAEQQCNFEHRDLHIGNILVKKNPTKTVSFKLDDETFNIPSGGLKITVIDFTLSRLTHCDKPVYNDLSKDPELFTSYGEYQFDIYRLMKTETNDQWHSYRPKTNIYWLHYVLDKMLTSVHYKSTSTATHLEGLQNLSKIHKSILCFDSVKRFAKSCIISNFF